MTLPGVDVLLGSIVSGVLLGGVLALTALGLSIVLGVMRLVKLAHGEFLMLVVEQNIDRVLDLADEVHVLERAASRFPVVRPPSAVDPRLRQLYLGETDEADSLPAPAELLTERSTT